jgi:hypothetical protein
MRYKILMASSLLTFSFNTFAGLCDGLPFYKSEAKAQGYDLPLGCGLSVIYNHLDEEIAVDGIRLISNDKDKQAGLDTAIGFSGLDIEEITIDVDTTILRFDVWLLPFLNVYALGGETKGTADVTVNIGNPGAFPTPEGQPPLESNYQFQVDFEGDTLGLGLTFAYGVENFFLTADINYSQTDVDVLDENATALVSSLRFGYDFQNNLRVWAGFLNEDIEETVVGPVPDGLIPPEILGALAQNNLQIDEFETDTRAATSISNILGLQYTVNENWNVGLEGAFGDRSGWLAQLNFRF